MAQGDADAREQLVHAERLRQVIVRAQIEGGHLVPLLPPRGEDDDRHL
jgi:hypothetical protein